MSSNRFFNFLSEYKMQLSSFGLLVIFSSIFVIINTIPPENFPRNAIVRIPAGTTIAKSAQILKSNNIIRSETFYKVYIYLFHSDAGIRVGDYLFEKAESSLGVAYRISHGEQNIQKVKITIPEGMSTADIANIIKKNIPDFNTTDFIVKSRQYEGYLFPETYYFFPNVTPDEVVSEMRSTFDDKLATIQDDIDLSTRNLKDTIIMASILEKEASNDTDRKMISGILWKRIDSKMPLQVDVPFYYSLNKTSSQLTTENLKTDSPYNTYTRKGLPIGPITNPGLASIEASLHPQLSKYWFFLSDKKGTMHYAITHDDHVANKAKYLK